MTMKSDIAFIALCGDASPVPAAARPSARRGRPRRAGMAARLALALVALAWSGAGAAAPLELDAAAIPWSRLVFQPPDRPEELTVEIGLTEIDAGRLPAPRDAASGAPPARPAGPTVWQLSSIFEVLYTGRTYRTDVWFSPEDASALLRHRDRLGRSANRKAYRYLADGVRRLRIEPDGGAEAELPPDKWSLVKEDLYPYGAARDDCPVLIDPNVLLVIASAGAVGGAEGPLTLCVFNKKAIYRVRLTAEPGEPRQVSYLAAAGGAGREVRREAAIRKIRLEALPPESGDVETETFEFFEMSGEIEIDLEAESGLPLRISGEIAGLGRIAVELSEAELRP